MSYTMLIDPTTGKENPELIARDSDGAVIPADPMNADWAAYQAWLEAGHKPTEPQAAERSSRTRQVVLANSNAARRLPPSD